MDRYNLDMDVAIIAISGRFPGASDVMELWRALAEGRSGLRHLDRQELLDVGVSEAEIDHPDYVPVVGAVDGIELFDADYFSYSAREAELLDPQQRFFLECCCDALQRAGYGGDLGDRPVGCFGATGLPAYLLEYILPRRGSSGKDSAFSDIYQLLLANDKDYLCTRVAYKLSLRGPCLTVQTGCSSSLVAVHLAVQSLLQGECDMALAGGVSLLLPQVGYRYQPGMILSPTGQCRAFAADADGTVSGNGVGIVVLKRLADALEDGDTICATIRGSAINNDGDEKVGFTAPGVSGQRRVIAEALEVAGMTGRDIDYVEAHGTGTRLGDPTEISALEQAFGDCSDHRCAIGSIKSAIGHLDAAAGVAGLIKLVLALQHEEIPPTLHVDQVSPDVGRDGSPFVVSTRPKPWPRSGRPRVAGVSSFGIGGTNAHVIVQEAPLPAERPDRQGPVLVPLSARAPAALQATAHQTAQALRDDDAMRLDDCAYTMQVGRPEFDHRMALVCASRDDAFALLRSPEGPAREEAAREGPASRPPGHTGSPVYRRAGVVDRASQEPDAEGAVLLFSGQGRQFPGMLAGLYQASGHVRDAVEQCLQLRESHHGDPLRSLLLAPDSLENPAELLRQTRHAQPALFITSYACARLWQALGLQVRGMLGHSVGEFVAACLAGVWDLRAALQLVSARGRIMDEQPAGAMLAVMAPENETLRHARAVAATAAAAATENRPLDIAAINGPQQCVLSGPLADIEAMESYLDRVGVGHRRLATSHAFHSRMMNEAVERFGELVARVGCQRPERGFVSSVIGEWIDSTRAMDPAYWASQIRQPVRFSDALGTLLRDRARFVVEAGPGDGLIKLARRHSGVRTTHVMLQSIPHRDAAGQASIDTWSGFLSELAAYWCAGGSVVWGRLYDGKPPRRVPLPGYPFERKRYWVERDRGAERDRPGKSGRAELVREPLERWFYLPTWRRQPLPPPHQGAMPERCILISDGGELAEAAHRALVAAGIAVELAAIFDASPGDNTGNGAGESIHAAAETSIRAALRPLLGNQNDEELVVVHAVTSTEPRYAGFVSLLVLAQELAERRGPTRIAVLCRGACALVDDSHLSPEIATVLGPAIVAPQELPLISCQVIELSDLDAAFGHLAHELASWPRRGAGKIALYSHGARWVADVEEFPLEPVSSPEARGTARAEARGTARADAGAQHGLRRGGRYLILGGLGEIGHALALQLGQTWQARLLLVGRRAAVDFTPTHRARMSALQSAGVDVEYVACDGCDPEAITELMLQDDLAGVIHVLGERQVAAVEEASIADGIALIDRKAQSLSALAAGLAARERVGKAPCDFVAVFSSLSTVIGALGFAGYAAAHCWVDGFVRKQRAGSNQRWMCINWDNWLIDEPWNPESAATDTSRRPSGSQVQGLLPAQGADALARSLLSTQVQVFVSPIDLRARREQWMSQHLVQADDAADADSTAEHEQSASAFHERPASSTPYVAAQTPLEAQLVAIWQQIMGVRPIGIHDNFFELGGDSIISIQFLARAKSAGIKLSSRQVFELQTVAELAAAAGSSPAHDGPGGREEIVAEQGVLSGAAPLGPMEERLFSYELSRPDCFNQFVALPVRADVSPETIEQALTRLCLHHDALRCRYTRAAGALTKHFASEPPGSYLRVVSLDPEHRPQDGAAVREQALLGAHRSLDIAAGRLLGAVLFRAPGRSYNELALVVHHLAVDVHSWRILIEDLAALLHGRAELPPKTSSVRQWVAGLQEHAARYESDEIDYWRHFCTWRPASIPVDFAEADREADNLAGGATRLGACLDAEATQGLRQRLGTTSLGDAVMMSLAKCLAEICSAPQVCIDHEGHGRDVAGLDLSRTVGWFTAIGPHFVRAASEDLERCLEQIREVPARGANLVAIQCFGSPEARETLGRLPRAEVAFVHMGTVSAESADQGSIVRPPIESGFYQEPDERRPYVIEVESAIRDQALHIEWCFSERLHRVETIQRWLDLQIEILHAYRRSSPKQSYHHELDAGDIASVYDELAQLAQPAQRKESHHENGSLGGPQRRYQSCRGGGVWPHGVRLFLALGRYQRSLCRAM